jgi:hypothetical protein
VKKNHCIGAQEHRYTEKDRDRDRDRDRR